MALRAELNEDSTVLVLDECGCKASVESFDPCLVHGSPKHREAQGSRMLSAASHAQYIYNKSGTLRAIFEYLKETTR